MESFDPTWVYVQYRNGYQRNEKSVYENIILLDTKGKVLVQLDESNPVSISKDPLIQESLRTHQGYFGPGWIR